MKKMRSLFLLAASFVSAIGAFAQSEKYTTEQPWIDLKLKDGTRDIQVSFDAAEADRESAWIDLNYNATYDKGEEITLWENRTKTYTTANGLLKIYGNIRTTNLAMCDLVSVKFSENHPVQSLNVGVNPISEIDFSVLHNLVELFANMTETEQVVDLSNCPNITKIDISESSFNGILLPENARLEFLFMKNAKVSEVDFSKCAEVKKIMAGGNGIKSLDVSNLTTLTCLGVPDNQLETIDVSKNTELVELYVSGNKLKNLDVSACPKLIWLNCGKNELSSLNIDNNRKLEYIWIESNQIKADDMLNLCKSLPDLSSCSYNGQIWVVDTFDEKDGNICNSDAVAIADNLNWSVLDFHNGFDFGCIPYPGKDVVDSIQDIEETGISVLVVNNSLEVSLPQNLVHQKMAIVDMSGHIIWKGLSADKQTISLDCLNAGVYALVVGNKSSKFIF